MKQHKFTEDLEESYKTFAEVILLAASQGFDSSRMVFKQFVPAVKKILQDSDFKLTIIDGSSERNLRYTLDDDFLNTMAWKICEHFPNFLSKALEAAPLEGDSFQELKKWINNLANLAIREAVKSGSVKVESKVIVDASFKHTIKDYFSAFFGAVKDLWQEIQDKKLNLSGITKAFPRAFHDRLEKFAVAKGGKRTFYIEDTLLKDPVREKTKQLISEVADTHQARVRREAGLS